MIGARCTSSGTTPKAQSYVKKPSVLATKHAA